MKILFMGTPEVAVPFLKTCAERHQIVGVVTQPDRPTGRKLEIHPPPVKTAAAELKLPVFQPDKPSEIADQIKKMSADIAVVVAYGRILKPDVLGATRHGFMNVHFSLLPKYRGAAPMQWSLIRGETETGVTLFWIDQGMDTGAIQSRRKIPVDIEDNVLDLSRKLIETGTDLLAKTLEEIAAGKIRRDAQAGEPSLAPKLTRQDAVLDFSMSASEFHNKVRGLRAGPKAYLKLAGGDVSVLSTHVDPKNDPPSGREKGASGTVLRVERSLGVLVQCTSGSIWIKEVQPEGKRQISAVDFVNGLRFKPGDRLVSNGK